MTSLLHACALHFPDSRPFSAFLFRLSQPSKLNFRKLTSANSFTSATGISGHTRQPDFLHSGLLMPFGMRKTGRNYGLSLHRRTFTNTADLNLQSKRNSELASQAQ